MRRKQMAALGLAALLAAANAATAFGGYWYADRYGDWYSKQDHGTSIEDGWHWINGKCYLFHDHTIYRDTVTPDGYSVNEEGEWTVDNVVQVRENENPDYCKDIMRFKSIVPEGPFVISKNVTDCGDYYDIECEFYPWLDALDSPAMEKGHVRLRKSALVHWTSFTDNDGSQTIQDMTLDEYAKMHSFGESDQLMSVRMDRDIVQDQEGYVIEFHDTNGG